MPFFVDGLAGTLWSTRTRKTITVTAALITSVLAAYSQIKANAGDLEHLIPASRPYARTAAEDAMKDVARKAADAVEKHETQDKATAAEIKRVLHRIQIEAADGKREATQNDLFKAGLEMKKAVKSDDEDTQQYIQKEIIRLQATLEKIDAQTKALNKVDGNKE